VEEVEEVVVVHQEQMEDQEVEQELILVLQVEQEIHHQQVHHKEIMEDPQEVEVDQEDALQVEVVELVL
jgi:hypothetical protein